MVAPSIDSAISQTYKDVENLIWSVCSDFVKIYGGDIEDAVSDANLTFVKAYEKHDESKGKFNTYLVTAIWNGLISSLRSRIDLKKKRGVSLDAQHGDMSLAEVVEDKRTRKWDRREFASDLSEDAKFVLGLVFDIKKIEEVAEGKGGEPRNWRSTIRNYLFDLNWAAEEINASFAELGNALRG